jgi:hypothetical protein
VGRLRREASSWVKTSTSFLVGVFCGAINLLGVPVTSTRQCLTAGLLYCASGSQLLADFRCEVALDGVHLPELGEGPATIGAGFKLTIRYSDQMKRLMAARQTVNKYLAAPDPVERFLKSPEAVGSLIELMKPTLDDLKNPE